jgi:hypothetical protein
LIRVLTVCVRLMDNASFTISVVVVSVEPTNNIEHVPL